MCFPTVPAVDGRCSLVDARLRSKGAGGAGEPVALAAPRGSVVPTNLAAILDKGAAVDGLAVPVGGDVLIADELALRRHFLPVAESQVAAALQA